MTTLTKILPELLSNNYDGKPKPILPSQLTFQPLFIIPDLSDQAARKEVHYNMAMIPIQFYDIEKVIYIFLNKFYSV